MAEGFLLICYVIACMFVAFQNEYLLGYKQARRRDDDIAIVNAGMRVVLEDCPDGRLIKECCLSFGGMAATTVVAEKTQQHLLGKYGHMVFQSSHTKAAFIIHLLACVRWSSNGSFGYCFSHYGCSTNTLLSFCC